MDDDMHSFIIKIPKPRVSAKPSHRIITAPHRKTKLSNVNTRRPSNHSLQKYSLPGSHPLPVSKIKNVVLLLPYRLFSKRQELERHKTRLTINIYDKYKIAYTDLRRRLYTDYPSDDVRGLKNIDPKFFQYVNGRSLSDGIPRYKSLGPELNNLFQIKLRSSLIIDCALRLEANMRKELQTYKVSVLRCKDQAQYFDAFISEDYLSSMDFLKKWEKLKLKLNTKALELQSLVNDKFFIMSRLIGLDYRYSVQQKYGRFLYYLSPPSWRANHRDFATSFEIEKKGFDLGYSSDEDPFVVLFEKLKQESCVNRVPPVLYFNRPDDLTDMFESIEKQQLHYLTYVTYSSPYAKSLKTELATLKTLIQQSSYSVVAAVNEFENIVKRENSRCNFIEAKFYKILNGMFYESVGSLEVLKMGLHLEYCHEKVLGEKPMHAGLKTVARVLESCYMDYCQRIDLLHSEDIKKSVQHEIELERRKMRKAERAARELRLFRRLQRELVRNCLPKNSTSVPLVEKPKPPPRPKQKLSQVQRPRPMTKVSRVSLTEAEREYLVLFTDWTENEDPVNYLQALTEKKNSKPEVEY